MTGPEHYREAERLLTLADSPAGHRSPEYPLYLVGAAQAHAALALTAATADTVIVHRIVETDDLDGIDNAWVQVTT